MRSVALVRLRPASPDVRYPSGDHGEGGGQQKRQSDDGAPSMAMVRSVQTIVETAMCPFGRIIMLLTHFRMQWST